MIDKSDNGATTARKKAGREREYMREYARARRASDNKFASDARYNAARVERMRAFKHGFLTAQGGCCTVCSGSFPLEVYDFHHIDPSTKEETVNHFIFRGQWALAEAEASKCVLVCANCHRMVHSGNATL